MHYDDDGDDDDRRAPTAGGSSDLARASGSARGVAGISIQEPHTKGARFSDVETAIPCSQTGSTSTTQRASSNTTDSSGQQRGWQGSAERDIGVRVHARRALRRRRRSHPGGQPQNGQQNQEHSDSAESRHHDVGRQWQARRRNLSAQRQRRTVKTC